MHFTHFSWYPFSSSARQVDIKDIVAKVKLVHSHLKNKEHFIYWKTSGTIIVTISHLIERRGSSYESLSTHLNAYTPINREMIFFCGWEMILNNTTMSIGFYRQIITHVCKHDNVWNCWSKTVARCALCFFWIKDKLVPVSAKELWEFLGSIT